LLGYGPHIGVQLVEAKVFCEPLEFDLGIEENKIDVQGLSVVGIKWFDEGRVEMVVL